MTAGIRLSTANLMGIITALIDDDQIAVVDFERAGIRMLRLDLAPLEKIG